MHLAGECVGPALGGKDVLARQGMSDGFGGNERIRHHTTEEIALARNAKLDRVLKADQRVAWDEIDLARVMGGGVVFAPIGKAYQGSEPLGDHGPGDPLMSIGEPACLRRVFDHHVVRQAMPPCERL